MIIAVSDLHLGDLLSNEKGFMSLVQDYLKPNQREITHLVLLGDMIDLWRRDNTAIIQKANHVFDPLTSLDFELHYIIGNHDFELADKRMEFREDFTIGKDLTLTDGKSKYRFIHGHQLNYWYVLPFYEFFSNAMCQITTKDETSKIWDVLKHNNEIPLDLAEKISALTKEKRARIEDKLAGPLLGQDYTIDRALLQEYEILESTANLSSFQTRNSADLLEEIESLSTRISRTSGRELFYQNEESSLISEIAKKYLTFWTQILHWSGANEHPIDFEKVFGQMKRIAGMFSTNLSPDEYLIHGHGHNLKVDQENKIADTGCWIGDTGSFISINGRYVESIRWRKA